MSLYENLGVSKDADSATIKRAYRKAAQKHHPDKNGNADKFHAIQRAYDVLGDDARRAHYDAHGTDGQIDKRGALLQRLAALFMQVIDSHDADHTDVVSVMKQALIQGKAQTHQHMSQNESKIGKYESVKKRLKKSGAGDNLLEQMLNAQITMLRRGIELGKTELSNVDEMMKMLEEYRYHVNPGSARTSFQSPGLGQMFSR